MSQISREEMLEREQVANRAKHWVRATTACNSKCLFCLDMDTPRGVYIPEEDVRREIDRGRDELGADKVIISGGEASIHPKFVEFVAYARSRGYARVQTVTNGYRFADADFFEACMQAGLGEITFSLHGHTPELHDHLTQTPGAFRRLMKGLLRAVRDRRPIVNVDIVINKQNVGVLDKVVELCITAGIREFDLLHVIPQAAAFDNRDVLFYDVREHMETLHKVFRLNRHPGFFVWTNRFPVSYLEGLEDLIQDPHKMLDEVNGRRFQVRRYLDEGSALDCRQVERCVHCFIEPFCTTMDRVVAMQNANAYEVWWVGAEKVDSPLESDPLPFGCTFLGVERETLAEVQALDVAAGLGIYARVNEAEPLQADRLEGRRWVLLAPSAAHLEAWSGTPLPDNVEIEVWLNRSTAPWLAAHREYVASVLEQLRIHQPSYEHMKDASENDIDECAAFFEKLDLAVRVSGLPACLAPGARLVESRRVLRKTLFDATSGRLAVRDLARLHVGEGYLSKSTRCADCRVNERCEGAHVNMIRDKGLKILQPLTVGAWADEADRQLVATFPTPLRRLSNGRPTEPIAPSLNGFAPPQRAPMDPLAIIHVDRLLRRQARAGARSNPDGQDS